ncbi:DNA polymerase epsilon subunit B, putative [Plasmodium malariae]|uniref:DNA polymerase II subunit 2 n=1 Tax=Plasmodium malariae TaxID=5858 RepID=A0A1A8WH52_PLAMA|nr:DNA polymerase epsilon subunit B, putative [Plasmodium malariae]SBS91122.1 DNA polymerase epsilon subunit b, putative [Plasmodium malariae]SCP03625.1 DNA polymerase epsilon subunit B, putative [Plasmodium malariae]
MDELTKEKLISNISKKYDIKNINLYITNIEEHIIKIKNEGTSLIDEVFLAFNGSIGHLSLYSYLFDHNVNVDLNCLNFIYEHSYIEEEKVIEGENKNEKRVVDITKFDSDLMYYIVKEYKENYEEDYNLTIKDLEDIILKYKENIYEEAIKLYKEKYNDGVKVYNTFLDLCHFYYDEKKMKFLKKKKVDSVENYNEYINANTDVEFYELKYHLLTKKTKGHPSVLFWSDAVNEIHIKDKTIITSVDAVKLTNTGHQHIIGILGLNRDGELVIQGIRNEVKLFINNNCVINHGIYCIGHIILVQGRMKLLNKTFYATEIMHPPRNYEDEKLEEDLFYGFENEKEKKEIKEYEIIVKSNDKKQNWVVMHDVYLDNPYTFEILEKMFSLYVNTYPDNDLPIGFIFMGDFISLKFDYNKSFNNIYVKGFEKLSVLLISKFKLILQNCYLVFIPGKNDPCACKNSIPKLPILPYYIKKFEENVNSFFSSKTKKKIIFATNPCRIRHFNKKMIFFRHDILNDLIWSSSINATQDEKKNLQNILVSTIIGQSHIFPITHDNRILKRYSSFLFLYPLPNFICISDNTCNSFISYASDNTNDAIISNSDLSFTRKKAFTVYNVLQHEAKRYVVPI